MLTKTKYSPAFFKEGYGDGAQNSIICFTWHRDSMILLTNCDNGELAFRPLLEGILDDTVAPWYGVTTLPKGFLPHTNSTSSVGFLRDPLVARRIS
ncbi:hypothetical protein [Edaphobacter modestus]|uniref:hypothetical protein n=1 Tax=Edaphobacter modestus TaxID=388466 RepID=UPI001A911A3D|nr:hypothetical protein [Edaphobacter modestus]